MPLTCLAIAACVLVAAPAGHRAPGIAKPEDARTRIEAYLDSHDIATAADLRGLATAPETPLMAIALDGKAKGLIRARAVAALRMVPSPEVRDFLGKLLRSKAKSSEPAERLIVRRAAVALGWLAAPQAPADLALLFENADSEVRVDAAIGLGLTRAADAPIFLRRQLAVESVQRVRNQIERQLRLFPPPPPPPAKSIPMREEPPIPVLRPRRRRASFRPARNPRRSQRAQREARHSGRRRPRARHQ